MLHTVRTQAEHFRLDEPAMRAAVTRLLTQLDLHDVTLLGESMGAVLALTAAADLPDRIRRVVAVNAYDYPGGIARSSLLARLIVTGVVAPGVGPVLARLEPKPVMRAILTGGLVDPTALREDYLDELLTVGRHPGYSTVARAVYRNLPSLAAARTRYPRSPHRSTSSTETRTGPAHRTGRPTSYCCPTPSSPSSRTPATSSPWNGPTCQPPC
jgi:pimeloyl-ACP methyl ester carboxylesterase